MLSKNNIRAAVISMRDGLDADIRADYDRKIFNRLIDSSLYHDAGVIFTYVSFNSEVDTRKLIEHSLKCGKKICVPRINRDSKAMEVYYISAMEDLAPGYFGILEPNEGCARAKSRDMDLVIMPGLAFDRRGNRIGYGRGFYDRYLLAEGVSAKKIALAYHFQVMDRILSWDYDVRVDGIITDEKTILIREKQNGR